MIPSPGDTRSVASATMGLTRFWNIHVSATTWLLVVLPVKTYFWGSRWEKRYKKKKNTCSSFSNFTFIEIYLTFLFNIQNNLQEAWYQIVLYISIQIWWRFAIATLKNCLEESCRDLPLLLCAYRGLICKWDNHRNLSSLVQVMAFRLFGDKPLPEQIMTHCPLDPWEQTSQNLNWNRICFNSRKYIGKFHFVQASMW